ncbi:MAG: DUF362 domain-containing protein, partial [Thermodesulfobacteriota bacterium]
ALLKPSGDVYLKVNAVDHKPYAYTDPEVLRAVIDYFKSGGARNIYVIENCTQGNITRLVFKVTGLDRVCRQTGAIAVYLDETEAVPVYLEGLQSFIEISAFVYERLMEQADQNLYISLPKLKTHSMSQVTLSIKNQFGLVHQSSRIADHNFRLHQKFADIYRLLQPDFVVVDGLIATNHGHYIAQKHVEQCVVPMDCLIAGADALAVDTVAAKFLGYERKAVYHLERAAQTGIGQSRPDAIRIVNEDIFQNRRQALTHELLDRFPPDLTILRGTTRCCPEGCRRNTETVVEIFYNDHGGKGDFTILMGKDIDPDAVADINAPVHIAGSCAISDYGPQLTRRFGKKNVTFSHGCNNLSETVHALFRHMQVSPFQLAGMNPAASLFGLARARLNGSKALIPPLL